MLNVGDYTLFCTKWYLSEACEPGSPLENPSHQQSKKEISYDHKNRCREKHVIKSNTCA